MSKSTYFFRGCPTCGRTLQIRVEYLGKRVVCQHCRAVFEASDPESDAFGPLESSLSLLRRADELLNCAAAQRRMRPR